MNQNDDTFSKILITFTIFLSICFLGVLNVNANIICNDGTESQSCASCHRGCCSNHDGCSSSQHNDNSYDNNYYPDNDIISKSKDESEKSGTIKIILIIFVCSILYYKIYIKK